MFLGQNVGQQCVTMSLCSLLLLLYHIRDQLTANDLAQISNIGNLFYSSFSRLTRQVRITNSITCVRHWLSTGIQWKLLWYCSPRNYNRGRSVLYLFMKSLWVAHIWKQHQYIITLRCIAVTTYCNSKIGFKYLILVLEICMVEGSLKVQVFFLKHCPLIVLCIIFQSMLNGIFEVSGVQVENIQNRMVSQHSVNEPQTSI